MPSLDESFHTLQEHLVQRHVLNPAQSDPIYYFVHDPTETFLVKQKLGVWSAQLKNKGWNVVIISLSKILWDIIESIRAFLNIATSVIFGFLALRCGVYLGEII